MDLSFIYYNSLLNLATGKFNCSLYFATVLLAKEYPLFESSIDAIEESSSNETDDFSMEDGGESTSMGKRSHSP